MPTLYTPLQAIWTQHRPALLGIYALNILSALCSLGIAPAAGLMIDTLLHHRGYGILAFVGIYAGWQCSSISLKVLDTIVFSRIFNQLSLQLLNQQTATTSTTKLNARIELMKTVVNFFENDLPFLMNSIVGVFGSCLLLYLYSWRLLLVSLIIIGPSVWINRRFARKIQGAAKAINDQYEHQVDVITSLDKTRQLTYFTTLRTLSIHRSTLEATNFAFLEVFVFAMIFTSIYLISRTEQLDEGQIVGAYGLIFRFAYGFDVVPLLTSRIASLRDILRRMATPIND